MAVVSIIVPCYNQAVYLPETLQSVKDQTFVEWECIIVNDGSTDNTEQIAYEWVSKDGRFMYLSLENGGVSRARNIAIGKAKGKYILPLDSDDLILPEYIQQCVNVLEKDSTVKLIYPKVELFGAETGKWNIPDYSYQRLLWENMIINAGVFRREDFLKTSGYNENMIWGCEDWDFWLTFLYPDDKVVQLDSYLFRYRIKERSRNADIQKLNGNKENMYRQIFLNHQDLYMQQESYISCRLERDKIKNSRQYKLGCLLMTPLSKLRRLFRK